MARYLSLVCVLLLVCSWQQTCEANYIMTAKKFLDYAMKVYDKIEKFQKFVEGEFLEKGQDQTISDDRDVVEREIYKQLDRLSTDFQDLRDRILDKISNQLRDKLTEKTDELFTHIKDVQRLYKVFVDFLKNHNEYESTELKDFAQVVTTFSLVEMRTTIEKMHETLVDPDIRKDSIISIITKDSSAADTMCIREESSQQLLHDLYQTVILTDVKGLMVTLYSYRLKEHFENRTYEFRKNKEINDYFSRVNSTFDKVKNAMSSASREVWKCDPEKHQKDITYDKLQEIFQAYFIYEVDTTHNNWHAAFHTCAALKDDRLRCKSYPCEVQPEERRCTGHLRDCQQVSHYMQVCHSPRGSERRYDWMKTGEGILFGRDGPCDNTQGLVEIPPYFISFCLCNCESEGRALDRYFSLEEVTSDIADNKVVTGLRLTKENHVFHIQIQQGKLAANGSIDGEPEWKKVTPIPESKLISDNVSSHHFVIHSHPHENDDGKMRYDDWTEFHKNDLVYAVTYKQNIVYLDNLETKASNELLTGLRFRHVDDALRLEIQTTPFDYATGKLGKEPKPWIVNESPKNNRHEVALSDPDDPSKWYKSDRFSKNNEFVRFRMDDLRRDLGQFTVPYIDKQEIVTHPPLPLSGAGLYHKGKLHSGGFLGLKVMHYDFTPHL